MSEVGFTKGPWVARAVQTAWPAPASGSTWTIDVKDKSIGLAIVEDDRRREYGPPAGQAESNAHLIAAAPDLYEALGALTDACEYQHLRELAWAALAKARGETK